MYRKRDREQQTLEEFILPFGGKLRLDNRWVKLSRMMPWDYIEDIYAQSMSEENGAKALSARIAFGALYIKEHENLTDVRTVEYIAENPYMQYFLGLHEYRDTPLFDSSMMVHFRKRFTAEQIEGINKKMFMEEKPERTEEDPPPLNSGKLVLDATCGPADIRYPSDLSLLNEARENTEEMIEELWAYSRRSGHKTRYNRKKARRGYLSIAKQKRPRVSKARAAMGKHLEYLRNNLEDIGDLLLEAGLSVMKQKRLERLMVICELYRQQSAMHESRSHQCERRIVSLRQPHIRPMVRGKAGRRFEFGQKLALSVVNGYTFIEKQSFESFHEGVTLIESVERYRDLHGCYPEVVQADQIYRNRKNLAFCKEHGIRLSGPRLGRPGKDLERDRAVEAQDHRERIIIESRIGIVKRRFGLDLIMATLPETALTEGALQVLCMNTRLRLLWRLRVWLQLFSLPQTA
jgi:hypothetical protein